MYRLLLIYDFDDVFREVEGAWLNHCAERNLPVNVLSPTRDHVMGLIRGLLREQFFLNVLPDKRLRRFDYQRDVLNLKTVAPQLIARLHHQMTWPLHLDYGSEWAAVSFTQFNELIIEFDYRPTDFSVHYSTEG